LAMVIPFAILAITASSTSVIVDPRLGALGGSQIETGTTYYNTPPAPHAQLGARRAAGAGELQTTRPARKSTDRLQHIKSCTGRAPRPPMTGSTLKADRLFPASAGPAPAKHGGANISHMASWRAIWRTGS
jgi:hypothetical protein